MIKTSSEKEMYRKTGKYIKEYFSDHDIWLHKSTSKPKHYHKTYNLGYIITKDAAQGMYDEPIEWDLMEYDTIENKTYYWKDGKPWTPPKE